MSDTRAKLQQAVVDVLRSDGISGLSARVIAARAEVNQALVFYHFGTVTDLVDQACRAAVDEVAASYHDELATVSTLRELLDLGRGLHDREKATGNVAVMAQLMAGAQQDETLAGAARYAMERWNAEIEAAVARTVAGSPIADLIDSAGLARAISAAFLGLELYEGVDPDGATTAFDALDRLGTLLEVVDGLGPTTARLLRSRLRRAR